MLLSTTKRTPYPLSIPPLLTKKKKVRRSVSQERGEEETSFKTDFCGNWFPGPPFSISISVSTAAGLTA